MLDFMPARYQVIAGVPGFSCFDNALRDLL